MKDTTLYEHLLGLESPWHVKRVKLSTEKKSVTVEVTMKLSFFRNDPDHELAPVVISGWVEREWQFLKSCKFETLIKSRIPILKHQDGHETELNVPWAKCSSCSSTAMKQKNCVDVAGLDECHCDQPNLER